MTLNIPREAQPSPASFTSLGLKALLDQMRDDRTYSILDLGPALQGNVRFWSRFSCRLQIQDFHRGYREWKAAAGPEQASDEAALAALLPFGDDTVFDIILAWDLFNYFDPRPLEALIRRLSRWCRPGTKLFALVSDLPNIPASPMMFKIIDRERLISEIAVPETRPCPRHQPRDIARLMAGFTVSCSFLLRRGIQEYIFAFK
jgi:hypothetical protein